MCIRNTAFFKTTRCKAQHTWINTTETFQTLSLQKMKVSILAGAVTSQRWVSPLEGAPAGSQAPQSQSSPSWLRSALRSACVSELMFHFITCHRCNRNQIVKWYYNKSFLKQKIYLHLVKVCDPGNRMLSIVEVLLVWPGFCLLSSPARPSWRAPCWLRTTWSLHQICC